MTIDATGSTVTPTCKKILHLLATGSATGSGFYGSFLAENGMIDFDRYHVTVGAIVVPGRATGAIGTTEAKKTTCVRKIAKLLLTPPGIESRDPPPAATP